MKAFALLSLFFISAVLQQPPLAKELVGIWKVADISVDAGSPLAANTAAGAQMKAIVSKLTFEIRPDHHFFMKGNISTQQMPEGIWSYDVASHIIKVTQLGHPESRLANILVKKDAKGQVFFTMMETPMTLKVHK